MASTLEGQTIPLSKDSYKTNSSLRLTTSFAISTYTKYLNLSSSCTPSFTSGNIEVFDLELSFTPSLFSNPLQGLYALPTEPIGLHKDMYAYVFDAQLMTHKHAD